MTEIVVPDKIPDTVVRCKSCTEPLVYIFDHRVRDTCAECGGKAVAKPPEKVDD